MSTCSIAPTRSAATSRRCRPGSMRQLRVPFRLPQMRAPAAALARLNETIYRLIHDRRASGLDKGDLLSMLLLSQDEETGRHLTDEQVRDEAMTLFVAGHETTAQAMAWSWYLLAQHPEHFERLRNEGMPYALQVMKESMRLYPPAFVLARSALRDTSIGGFPVRKDEIVLIAPWLLHRDPRLFEDPLRFDPDRFLPEREAALPRFAYMPFGGGKRICIGNQFALMEGQIILSTIAEHVSMELVSQRPIGLQPFITLRPKGGVNVKIRRLTRVMACTTASGASSCIQCPDPGTTICSPRVDRPRHVRAPPSPRHSCSPRKAQPPADPPATAFIDLRYADRQVLQRIGHRMEASGFAPVSRHRRPELSRHFADLASQPFRDARAAAPPTPAPAFSESCATRSSAA